MKKLILIFLIIFILINLNIFSKKIINPIDDNAKKLIEEVEEIILEYIIKKNLSYINEAKSKIKKLEEVAENNKYFEAKVIGLSCQLEMAYNNFENIEKYISDIEKRNKNEEKLFIIKSELEKDKNIKEKILLDGIKKNEDSIYLKLYLANNYYLSGNFDKALKYYDEIFFKLPELYKNAYKNQRDLSSKFSKNPLKSLETIDILIKEEISINDMLKLILFESNFLFSINISQTQSIEEIFNILKNNDFFYLYQAEKISLDSLLKRKDLAYFLLKLLIKLENNPSLKNKYISNLNITSEDNKSPIVDVDVNHYFYNAVLVLIEKEILELPDGELFYPEKKVSGIKFYEIIKKLEDIYKF